MKIEITSRFTPSGREYFEFEMWDGPNGVEHVRGFSVDLINTFTKLIEWREMIARDYQELPSQSPSYTANKGPENPE